ncbi:MAG: hypothetical protein J1E31_03225 [Helicobacter sp.]|nr:hypothetical protein [Helicobacter sp.]
MSYAVKIEGGKAKVYEGKSFKRSLGSGVTAACCSDEWVLIIERGRAKQYAAQNGSFKRNLGDNDATAVSISGDSVIIGYANGKFKEYKASSGSFRGSAKGLH